MPENLCQRGRNSSIVFLFLGYNQLTGSLPVSLGQCGSLSFIDVTVSRSAPAAAHERLELPDTTYVS